MKCHGVVNTMAEKRRIAEPADLVQCQISPQIHVRIYGDDYIQHARVYNVEFKSMLFVIGMQTEQSKSCVKLWLMRILMQR